MNDGDGSAARPTMVDIVVVRSERYDALSTRTALRDYILNPIAVVPDAQTVLTLLAPAATGTDADTDADHAPRAALVLADTESGDVVRRGVRSDTGLRPVPLVVLDGMSTHPDTPAPPTTEGSVSPSLDFDGLVAAVKEIDSLRISVLTFADRRRRPR